MPFRSKFRQDSLSFLAKCLTEIPEWEAGAYMHTNLAGEVGYARNQLRYKGKIDEIDAARAVSGLIWAVVSEKGFAEQNKDREDLFYKFRDVLYFDLVEKGLSEEVAGKLADKYHQKLYDDFPHYHPDDEDHPGLDD